MKKKVIKLAAVGFPLGIAVGVFISLLSFSRTDGMPMLAARTLVQRLGSENSASLVHVLLSGLLGSIAMGGTVCYEIENWSLIRASLTHWAMIMVSYFAIALYCGWIAPDGKEMLIMGGIMTAVYIIIFMIMYLRYRREAEELNRELRGEK